MLKHISNKFIKNGFLHHLNEQIKQFKTMTHLHKRIKMAHQGNWSGLEDDGSDFLWKLDGRFRSSGRGRKSPG